MTRWEQYAASFDELHGTHSDDQNSSSMTDKPIATSFYADEQSHTPLSSPKAQEATRNKDANSPVLQLQTLRSQLFGLKSGKSLPQGSRSKQFQIVWRDLAYKIKISALQRSIIIFKGLFRDNEGNKDNGSNSTDNTPSFDPINISTKPQCSDADECETSVSRALTDSRSCFVFTNLGGYIRSGEITAILGPSGVGKTSLLKALSGFETKNYRGSIQLFGDGDKKRMQVSIIPQKDFLIENLSVHENLLYSSRILNVSKDFDHEAAIDHVVKVLNLTNCVQTLCKNLSGGEYKRVSIAQELLRQPDVLILDEPTSGLDSMNCKKLITTFRDLIEAGHQGKIPSMAIVITIHQPDVDIFSMFDHVYCLASGGRVVFDGHPRDTLEVLRTHGGITVDSEHDTVQTINPANLLIEVASKASHGDDTIDRLAEYQRGQCTRYIRQLESYPDYANAGERKQEALRMFDSDVNHHDRLYRDERLKPKSHKRGLFWYHTSILTKRCLLGTVKDPMVSGVSLGFHLMIPITMWFVYSPRIGDVSACPKLIRDLSLFSVMHNSTQSLMADMMEDFLLSYEGATMFFLTCWSFGICSGALAAMTFPLNMHILLKELRNGWYGMSSYVLGKTIASSPIEIIFPVMSLVLVYYILGMPESYLHWRMIAMALVMASIASISSSQGLVFGALFMNDPQTSIFMAIAITIPETLLSGYTSRVKHMPKALQYLSWFNPKRYSSDLNNMIRYGFGLCPCEPQTEAYLGMAPRFIDMPEGWNSVVKYYVTNMRDSDLYEADTSVAPSNATAFARKASIGTITGVNYEFIGNATTENEVLELIKSDQLDFEQVFAGLFAKSMSYGRDISDCDGVRSQVLEGLGMPPDQWAPYMFVALLGLLVLWRILLYFVVKHKIESYQ